MGKEFLSSIEKYKVIDRKENYGTVAIFREGGTSARYYFEVPLGNGCQLSYSVRGEFNRASEGSILIHRHFEPKKKLTYTSTYDAEKDLLEGMRTESEGNSVGMYMLTYMKLYTKGEKSVQGEK